MSYYEILIKALISPIGQYSIHSYMCICATALTTPLNTTNQVRTLTYLLCSAHTTQVSPTMQLQFTSLRVYQQTNS